MMTTRRMAALAATLALAGCGASDEAEIKTWMAEVESTTQPSVKPLAEPKTFIPFAYGVREEVDPFDPNKLLAELARAANTTPNPLRPDMDRRREFLETFPIDTMRMVGTLNKNGVTYGLIQIDRQVHQVKAGQRLGQNFGIVASVAETAINIRETVQDAGGEWVERMSKLELQESKETK